MVEWTDEAFFAARQEIRRSCSTGVGVTVGDVTQEVLDALAPHVEAMVREARAEAMREASDAAFKDKSIQGLQRVVIGNWLRNRAEAQP